MELLDEARVRVKNEITIPVVVRDILNLEPGDYLRFSRTLDGDICVCKAVTHKVNHVRCEN